MTTPKGKNMAAEKLTKALPFPPDWKMREGAHFHGGQEWFGYRYDCIQQPRLSRFDRYRRRDQSVTHTWMVDGLDCADAEAAWAALQVPPSLSDAERTFLMGVPDEPTHWTNRSADVLRSLRDKGMVQWGPPAHLSRTSAGRAAAHQHEGREHG